MESGHRFYSKAPNLNHIASTQRHRGQGTLVFVGILLDTGGRVDRKTEAAVDTEKGREFYCGLCHTKEPTIP